MSIYEAEKTMKMLKDFQRDTADWVFKRLFDEDNPTNRFLVADEVGLGKTIVAKGVVAQVLQHLHGVGDKRHDIVYICSNSSIARQNIKKLVPRDVEPLDNVERLTMLPVANLKEGDEKGAGINLLAISPGTSFAFGQSLGKYQERVLAYLFIKELWPTSDVGSGASIKLFEGSAANFRNKISNGRLTYQTQVKKNLAAFGHQIKEIDAQRKTQGQISLKKEFEKLCAEIKGKHSIPYELRRRVNEFIGTLRRALATVGINMLKPDLIILDEFQRFKDLMDPSATDWASTLARQLFSHYDEESGRGTKVLLLSATPYRMYARSGETDDHFADFLNTCSFLFNDPNDVDELKKDFNLLRLAMTNTSRTEDASAICSRIQQRLSLVMARTERLGVTPDRNGMLEEHVHHLPISVEDLKSYARIGDISSLLKQGEPIDYWKSSPYLFNFMDDYKLKTSFKEAMKQRALPPLEDLTPGPGLLDWTTIANYRPVDAQNARLRWLIEDLHSHNAFDLLWIPPSLRYYDSGSVYESEAATSFTKRVIFSGWTVVPKAVASLTSFEAERQAFRGSRVTIYEPDNRGDGRLVFRMEGNRPASMTTMSLIWPSVALANLGQLDRTPDQRPNLSDIRAQISAKIRSVLQPHLDQSPTTGVVDQSWYWLAPLILDNESSPEDIDTSWGWDSNPQDWGESDPKDALTKHSDFAWKTLNDESRTLGRPPSDLIDVLTDLAISSPAVCALRSLSAVSGLPISHPKVLTSAASIANSFRLFFNKAEVTAIISREMNLLVNEEDLGRERYWQQVIEYCAINHLQAVLDEHVHTLRDWLGFSSYVDEAKREDSLTQFAEKIAAALSIRAANFGVDIPNVDGRKFKTTRESMRTNFAAAYGQRSEDEKSVNRNESLSAAFNSPFWPFVLVSTSIGQEGLDFHLWSHAVVHWNLPSNPVDLEQREGRVHRYKGHVVRKNIAETLAPHLPSDITGDIWEALFNMAAERRLSTESEMVPYWVYPQGSAKIERHVPLLPFSRDASELPRLKNSLAAYRLAFGQPRQEDLVEFLRRNHSEEDISELVKNFKIDLTPPTSRSTT